MGRVHAASALRKVKDVVGVLSIDATLPLGATLISSIYEAFELPSAGILHRKTGFSSSSSLC